MIPLDREGRRAALFAPAPLAEAAGHLVLGELLLRELPDDDPDRARVLWRLLELRGRLDPLRVIAHLDALDRAGVPQALADRVRVEVLVACGQLDQAEAVLAGYCPEADADGDGDARWRVLRGQAALGRGDAEAAERHLGAALRGDLDDEWRALALLYRMEACARRRDADGVRRDAAALDELLEARESPVSRQMVRAQAALDLLPRRDEVLRLLFAERAAAARRRMIEGVDGEAATLGPIPHHVHGAFRKWRSDPGRLEAELLEVVALSLRAGRTEDAFATLYYADRIGERLLPAPAAARLGEAFAALCEHLGDAETQLQQEALRLRAEALDSSRPRRPRG